MNRLRTHIARVTTILFIGLGFGLYLVQPTQAKHNSQSFASWFSQMAHSSHEIELQDELHDLRKSATQLDQVIKQASRIVSSNNEDFAFSFEESVASHHLYQLLLIEWSQFQTENAMTSVPVPSLVKFQISATIDKLSSTGTIGIIPQIIDAICWNTGHAAIFDSNLIFALVPMVDSIAIGAP